MLSKKYYLPLFLVLLLACCKSPEPFKVDLSGVDDVKINIKRYEQALFSIHTDSIRIGLQGFKDDFSFFIGEEPDTFAIMSLYNYLTDPTIVKTFNDVQESYKDLKPTEEQLALAFRHLKFYLPEFTIPEVFSYVSGFDFEHPVKYASNTIVIGLDMYLGNGYYFYPLIGLPDYKARRMTAEAIPVDVMDAIATSLLPARKDQGTFLDRMLWEGKRLYFFDITLPFLHDSLKTGFTGTQLAWCERNEAQMWGFFMEQNFLYSTDRKIISRFMDDGPFTASFAEESPARTGAFIGRQIVRRYMENEETGLEELFKMNDAQLLLKKAKYKPRK